MAMRLVFRGDEMVWEEAPDPAAVRQEAIAAALAAPTPDAAYQAMVDVAIARDMGVVPTPTSGGIVPMITQAGGTVEQAAAIQEAALRSYAANEAERNEGTLEGMLSSGTEFAKEVAPLVLAAAATYGGASALGGALGGGSAAATGAAEGTGAISEGAAWGAGLEGGSDLAAMEAAVGGGAASGGATGAVSGGFESPLAGVPRAPIAVSGPATAIGEGGALSTALPAAETLGLNFGGALAGGAVATQAGGGMDFDLGGLEDGSITADDLNTIIGGDIAGGVYDDFGTPGVLKQIADALSGVVSNPLGFAKSLLAGDKDAMKKLAQLGVPAALIAGLIEKNDSPLVEPMRRAAEAAYASAGQFGTLEGPGITPSQQMAIERARTSSGAWRPDLDRAGTLAGGSAEDNAAFREYFTKAGALADQGSGGVTDEMRSAYLNPYLKDVLDPAVRDVEEAAERRRQQLRSQVARSGNDFRTPGTVNRFNVEDDLLDATMLDQIGTLSGKLRYQGWDSANALAKDELSRKLTGSNLFGALGGKTGDFRSGDLNRKANASTLYGNLAKTRGALDTVDIENLRGAGTLERQPYEDRRANLADTAKLYTGVVHGTAPALSATTPDSFLTKGAGALGTYNTLFKKGGVFGPSE